MCIGLDTLLCQATRSRAANVASLHEPKPNAVLSFSAVLRQFSFGLPRLLLPSGAHVNAVLRIFIWIYSDNAVGADVSPLSNLLI